MSLVATGLYLAASGCAQAFGGDAEITLQHLHHTRRTQGREVPVVADVGARDGHIVGVAFHQDLEIAIVGEDFCNLRERGFRTVVHFVRAGAVEHVVGQRHIRPRP